MNPSPAVESSFDSARFAAAVIAREKISGCDDKFIYWPAALGVSFARRFPEHQKNTFDSYY